MKFELLHPTDQLVMMMNRIYKSGLTTTSGGNLSILDDNGDVWITPMAFAVTDEPLDPRTIPESYINLRHIKKVPFAELYLKPETVADMFSEKTPVLICENNQILATGSSLLNAFDRLEVTEATAHSILAARDLGDLVHISDSEIEEINKAFHLN